MVAWGALQDLNGGESIVMAREVMRRDFAYADPDESLASVVQTMRLARLRHLLVVREGALLGILTYRDLLEQLAVPDPQATERMRVADVMSQPPICIGPDAQLTEAADRICRYRIGCLPVLDGEGQLLGLVTEADLLRAAYGLRSP